jgi:hypothetical protein
MDPEKRYSKIKIFLFLFFTVIAAVLVTSVVRLTQELFSQINIKNNEFKCTNLNFNVNTRSYKGNNLVFEISSNSFDVNRTIVKIVPDTSSDEREYSISPKGVDTEIIMVDNISLVTGYYVYLDNCKNKKIFAVV